MSLSGQGKDDMFDQLYPFYCLLEVASNDDPDVVPEGSERLLEFIDTISDHIEDGIVPQGEGQARHIWDIRENLAPVAMQYGLSLMYDISLDTANFYKCIELTR